MARELGRTGISEPGAMEDEDLELSLSIGGSCRKAAPAGGGPTPQGSDSSAASGDANVDPSPGGSFGGGDPLDSLRRREMHALRRQEARRKREEKQQRKGIYCGGGLARVSSVEDRAALERQASQSRARAREAREQELPWADRWPLGRKTSEIKPQIPEIISGARNPHPNPAMPYPYHQVQYVPVVNGFGVPCIMPCWAPTVSSAVTDGPNQPERNVYQPVAGRFPSTHLQPKGCYPGLNGGKSIAVKKSLSSTESPGSSSSGISVHQGRSLQGGSSSSGGDDVRSHSGPAIAEKPRPQISSQVGDPQENSGRSMSHQGADKLVSSAHHSSLVSSPNAPASIPGKLEEAASVNKPIATAGDPKANSSSSLPRMPCVVTTGNGPNGKTITGFLYSYSKSEVSIVCVCHGSSFSPAEFVKHAGGTNISHPLRQIVVVPS